MPKKSENSALDINRNGYYFHPASNISPINLGKKY